MKGASRTRFRTVVPTAVAKLAAVANLAPASILLAALGAARAEVEVPLDERPAAEALPAMIQEMMNALPHDATVWERYLSEEAVYVSEAGEVAAKAELLADFGPFPSGLSGSIQVKNPQITELDDLAVVVFDAEEKQTVFEHQIEVSYLVTHVWRRESARWRLITSHTAVRAKDPSPLPVDEDSLAEYVGTYELDGEWRYSVVLAEGGLAGGSEGREPRPLIAVGDNVFTDAGNPLGVLRIFARDAGGRVDRMIYRRKFADLVWTLTRD